MERTASVTVNNHGCRYPSRHDYGIGTSVTLQLVGSIVGSDKPQTVRAMVRSVHPPASLRELQQVGVELETPGNVWGIVPAPKDWTSAVETNASTTKLTGATANATGSDTKSVPPLEVLRTPAPKMAELVSIPSLETPRPLAQPSAGAPQAKRVVVTPDGLISALQGKLQQEAEKAVQAALAKQVHDRIQDALREIDDARQAGMREVRDVVPAQIKEIKLSLREKAAAEWAEQRKAGIEAYRERADEISQGLKEQASELRRELASAAQQQVEKITRDIAPLPARLTEAVRQATSDFEGATAAVVKQRYEQLLHNVQIATQEALVNLTARSEEMQALSQNAVNSGLEDLRRETEAVRQATSDFESATAAVVKQRYEQLLHNVQIATQEALVNLTARSEEMQALSQNAVNSGLEDLRRETERHVNMALADARERSDRAMSSLDAESGAICDQRRQSFEQEVSRLAERATDEFRKGMQAFLHSCLAAAMGAVDKHSRATLDELLNRSGDTPEEPTESSRR